MIAEVFGPGGLLEKKTRQYEFRDGQVRMAEAVADALSTRTPLAIEAPCGIGKTYAYLIPAIEHALKTNSRVIVCTANIALQEQLFEKDLPALRKIFPDKLSFALIKGINNYLCLDRFEEVRGMIAPVTFDRKELKQWHKIAAWRDETKTGDVSDLDFTPEDGVWSRVNGVSELCNGSQCRFYDECFAMDARRRLRSAQVIVTNYHLFFAHLRMKAAGAGDVILPPASVVICDEAHDMADIARDFFGMRLTPYSMNMLVRGANFLKRGGLAERLRQASRAFFARVCKDADRRLRSPDWIDTADVVEVVAEYKAFLDEVRRSSDDEETGDKIAKFLRAADHYLDTLDAFRRLEDPNMVYWVDKDRTSARLQSRLIDVSGILRSELFESEATVVLTSATLTAAGQFDFIRKETGADTARELRVASPFDYERQMILIVPKMSAAPNDPRFASEMSAHLNRIIRFLGGRTLCLFTSYRNLEACADAVEGETDVTVLRQGDAPRSALLKEFRKDEGTALFATASFWQGVDIPGEALSCLAIDKIPFANPGDPLIEALQERDPSCFTHYSLPKAILDLRQGFGRLIRTQADRGVVVVFDNRLYSRSYGGEVLASLPECRVYRDLDALEKFFKTGRPPVE